LLKIYPDPAATPDQIGDKLSQNTIWVDLLNASEDENRSVERLLGIRIPSEEALSEIEASSRLIADHGKLYLSSPAVRLDDRGDAYLTPIGFIIGPRILVTVRFSTLPIFDAVAQRVGSDDSLQDGVSVFTTILEAMVDRGADVLEQLGATTDALSRDVFKGSLVRSKKPVRSSRKMREALERVGVMADRLALARDVLLGVQRIAAFASDAGNELVTPAARKRLDSISKDVASLSDYETRLSDKIQLLLDAVLGFINIQQNDLFKILTIVSVVGVPPTILVGVWGMNFKNMPELNWTWGYLLACLVIIASGVLPLLWFKRRGWFD
jgi:magnesium transporter